MRELARYAPELANKPQVVVLNKTDAIDPEDVEEYRRELRRSWDRAVHDVGRDRRRHRPGAREAVVVPCLRRIAVLQPLQYKGNCAGSSAQNEGCHASFSNLQSCSRRC